MDESNLSQSEQKIIEENAKKLVNIITSIRAIMMPTDDFLHESSSIITYLKMLEFDKKEMIKWNDFLESFINLQVKINDTKNILDKLDKQLKKLEMINKKRQK